MTDTRTFGAAQILLVEDDPAQRQLVAEAGVLNQT